LAIARAAPSLAHARCSMIPSATFGKSVATTSPRSTPLSLEPRWKHLFSIPVHVYGYGRDRIEYSLTLCRYLVL
jgi:hypothetical protein